MYGGSGKLGRGGGGGGGRGCKRPHASFPPPPPPHRVSAPGSRLSIGSGAAPRARTGAALAKSAAASATPPAVEEAFSLVNGNPLAFAAIIRLAPDLVDEIKRVEAQGGSARIKFDSNANNTTGNVIEVGGKDFRFTWSRELGDLCDIYEERQNGEDGNGLLVESGCPWRKLNVQRILDESTKNHVKMRSEEAERKLKSRKAIVLEHGNPSMKSQAKAMAAVEVNQWRMGFKQKKEPAFKKRKVESLQVGGPPKSVHRSGTSTITTAKSRRSPSPLRSPLEQSAASASPSGILSKGRSITEDAMPAKVLSKENAVSMEKEIPSKAASGVVQEKPGRKGNFGATPADLQSMLITLLTQNPKGMSLKALEKAIGDTIPNSVRKIEPIIKKIANYQAPGRYFLKPGVESESLKKPSSESGSSPEDNRDQACAIEDGHDERPAIEPNFVVKTPGDELVKQAKLNSKLGEESTASEKIDIQRLSPDLFGDKSLSDNSEGQAGSSSGSGSDSDSESDSSDSGSDSGSHSRSRSKSRSPVGSGSGSSSESESDASSNSKEGSDEDVDIMTSDDDKESKPKLQPSDPQFSSSPFPWKTPDGGPMQNGIDERQDGHVSDVVDIEKNLPDDDDQVIAFSPNHDEHRAQQAYVGNMFDGRDSTVNGDFRHDQYDSAEKSSRGKSKRSSDVKHFNEKPERDKKLKLGSTAVPPISGVRDAQLLDGPYDMSPDRQVEDHYKGSTFQMVNGADRVENAGFGSQKNYNLEIPGKSISNSQQSGWKSVDLSAQAKVSDTLERNTKRGESLGYGSKYSEKSAHVHEGFPMQNDKIVREAKNEDGYVNEKKQLRNSKEGGFGEKHSTPFESRKREKVGKFKDAGQAVNSQMGSSPKDNNRNDVERFPVVNGRGSILHRELSDLELGELREPLPEETPGVKKQTDRKGSFKQSENRPGTSDNWNSEFSKGKPLGKANLDSTKPSPLNRAGPGNKEGLSKRTTPEVHLEDLSRPRPGVVQSQHQQVSGIENTEVGAQLNKLADISSKTRQNETGVIQEIGMEGSGENHKKASVDALQKNDSKRGLAPHSLKENKMQKPNMSAEMCERRRDSFSKEMNNGGLKRRIPSSDENSCSYSKYEKEEPELKGPIKDFSQYKEYVQEYHDKYDSYCSLNKILENYRNDFCKLGRDLEIAKGRDGERYFNILGQLNESYRQCGTRHKRLKKIFVVLHEELKHLKQRIKDYAVAYSGD